MMKLNIRTITTYIKAFFVILPLFSSGYNLSIYRIEYLRTAELIIGLTITSLDIIIKFKRKKSFNKILLPFLLFNIYVIFITVFAEGNINTALRSSIRMIYVCILAEAWTDKKEPLFIAIEWYTGILVIINLYTLIAFPEGMYLAYTGDGIWKMYFLGYDNSHIVYLLPCFCICQINLLTRKRGYFFKAVTRGVQLAVLLSVVISMSGVTVVAFAALLAAMFMQRSKILDRHFELLVIIPVIVTLVIVVFQRQINIISLFTSSVLHKSATFTGRTGIWKNALEAIIKKPIFGNGMFDSESMIQFVGGQHCHNHYLQLMYIGGFTLLGLFIWWNSIVYRRLKNGTGYEASFMKSMIFCIYICFVAETHYSPTMYMLIIFCAYMVEKPREEFFNNWVRPQLFLRQLNVSRKMRRAK